MYEPTRWWRVMRGDMLKVETSSEHEARSYMEPGDILYRLYEKKETEWRLEDTKPPRTKD